MALSIGSIATTFVVKTKPFESGVKRASASVKKMGNDVRTAGQRAADGFRKFSNSVVVQAAKIATAVAAIGFVKMGIGAAAAMQQDLITIKTFVGSAEKARDVMKSLREFATKTPFQLKDLIAATKNMLAFGFAQDEITDKLFIFGNLAAAANVPVGELTQIFGKIKGQGKLMGETLNQLAERGIPVISALAEHFKVPETAIREMVTAGKVSFDEMMAAMQALAGEGGKMGSLMEEQSKTLAGRWSTLKDQFMDVAITVGEVLIPALEKLVQIGSSVIAWVKNLDASGIKMNLTIAAMAGSFLMMLKWFPKIIRGLKLVITTLKGFAAASATANAFAMNFPGLIAATAAAAAAGVIIYKAIGSIEDQAEATANSMDDLINSSNQLNNAAAGAGIVGQIANQNTEAIKTETNAIEELNAELDKTERKAITVAVRGTAAEFSARQLAASVLERFQKAQLKAAEMANKHLYAIKKNTDKPLAAAGI
tara:strand:- start:12660 stop:14108 length:1449 start_codon:yes stop_codon:yes gene_type:complete